MSCTTSKSRRRLANGMFYNQLLRVRKMSDTSRTSGRWRAMAEQNAHSSLWGAKAFLVALLMSILLTSSAIASEINACKYLVVTDFTSDPYGIAKELRAQAITRGFAVVSSVTDVPQEELLKTCVMSGSWSRDGSGGEVAM